MSKDHAFLLSICRLVPSRRMLLLAASLLCLLLAAACNVYAPILLKKMVDDLGISHFNGSFLASFLSYGALLIAAKILYELKILLYAKWERILIEISFAHFFRECHKNNSSFFRTYTAGAIASKLFMSVWGLKNLTGEVIITILPIIIELILIFYSVLYFFNLPIAIIVICGVLSYILFGFFSNVKIVEAQRPLRNKIVETEGVLIELLLSWKDSKLLNSIEEICKLFERHTDKISKLSVKFTERRIFFNIALGMIAAGTMLATNYLTIKQFLLGASTIGNIFLINNYLIQILKPLESFVLVFLRISHDWNDFLLGRELENAQKEQTESFNSLQLNVVQTLTLNNVSLYPSLKNISISFKSQDRVAIVGESGAGKSSFFEAVTRLRDDYNGKILINDREIRSFPHADLRNFVQLIPADARLLDSDIADNLFLAGTHDVDNITAILTFLSLNQKINIKNLESISTAQLSQGERQRLVLARSWLKECRVRLYDESTSFLDPNLESRILDKVLHSNEDIVLFVTHRISTALQFPRVIVFNEGKVVEDGSPSLLLSKKGLFYNLWEKQCKHHLLKNEIYTTSA